MNSILLVRLRTAVVTAFLIGMPATALLDPAHWRSRPVATTHVPPPARGIEPYDANPFDVDERGLSAAELLATPHATSHVGSVAPVAWASTAPSLPAETAAGEAADGVQPGVAVVPGGDRLQLARQRLQDLGAVYMRLEIWGVDRPRYRFLCHLASPDADRPVAPFECAASDPVEAMEQVLADVESYVGGLLVAQSPGSDTRVSNTPVRDAVNRR